MKNIVIAGTIGKDAVLRRTQSGDPVTGFSVAVDDGFGENKGTIWFDVALWGKRGQSLEQHLTKGTKVAVSGELGKREHEGRTYLTVRANDITLMGGKKDGTNGREEQRTSYDEPARTTADDLNDDLPF